MNGYKAFCRGKELEVYAPTSYAAQKVALPLFQKVERKRLRESDVTVILCEKDGAVVSHNPGELP